MEPCLFRHGKTGGFVAGDSIAIASMEPCLFRHGKAGGESGMSVILNQLQWSHVFSDMVSRVHRVGGVKQSVLQWSHVFSDMVRRRNSRPQER